MTTTTRLTLDEFLALPPTEPESEYADGEVIQKPMPDDSHSFIQVFLGYLLLTFLSKTKLGRVGSEWRCIFGPRGGERAFVPDLVYVSTERLGPDRFVRTAPDLAIEILSPDQPMARFTEKIQFYLRHGVRLVWVIDPIEKTIAVLSPDHDPKLLSAGDTLDGGAVLPGFAVAVDEIFAQVRR